MQLRAYTIQFLFAFIFLSAGGAARAEPFFFNPNWQSALSLGAFYDDSLLFTETGLPAHMAWLPSTSWRYRLSSLMRLSLFNRPRQKLEVINLNRHIYSQNKRHHFADPSDAYISVLYKTKPNAKSMLKIEPCFYLFLQDNNFDAQREVVSKRAGLNLQALILHTHLTQRYYINSFYDFFLQPSKKVEHLKAPMLSVGSEYSLVSSSNQEARLRAEFSWYHAGHKDLNYKQGLVAVSYLQPLNLGPTSLLWFNEGQAVALYMGSLKWRFQARTQLAHNLGQYVRYGLMAYGTQLYEPKISAPAPAATKASATNDKPKQGAQKSIHKAWQARQLGAGVFISAGF